MTRRSTTPTSERIIGQQSQVSCFARSRGFLVIVHPRLSGRTSRSTLSCKVYCTSAATLSLTPASFITALGGGAFAWPLGARAQQSAKPVIGFLSGASPDGPNVNLTDIRRGLAETGYIEGQNVAIEYRWAQNQEDRLPAL